MPPEPSAITQRADFAAMLRHAPKESFLRNDDRGAQHAVSRDPSPRSTALVR